METCAVRCAVYGVQVWCLAFAIAVFLTNSISLSLCTDSVSLTSHSGRFSTCCCYVFFFFAFISLFKWLNVCCLTPCFCFSASPSSSFFPQQSFQVSVRWIRLQLNDIIQCFVIIKNRLVLKSEMLIYIQLLAVSFAPFKAQSWLHKLFPIHDINFFCPLVVFRFVFFFSFHCFFFGVVLLLYFLFAVWLHELLPRIIIN